MGLHLTRIFPGLLGRGLIEANLLVPVHYCEYIASPVYWAGASLKLLLRGRRGSRRKTFPGLLGRGLIEATTCC